MRDLLNNKLVRLAGQGFRWGLWIVGAVLVGAVLGGVISAGRESDTSEPPPDARMRSREFINPEAPQPAAVAESSEPVKTPCHQDATRGPQFQPLRQDVDTLAGELSQLAEGLARLEGAIAHIRSARVRTATLESQKSPRLDMVKEYPAAESADLSLSQDGNLRLKDAERHGPCVGQADSGNMAVSLVGDFNNWGMNARGIEDQSRCVLATVPLSGEVVFDLRRFPLLPRANRLNIIYWRKDKDGCFLFAGWLQFSSLSECVLFKTTASDSRTGKGDRAIAILVNDGYYSPVPLCRDKEVVDRQ